MAEPHDWDRREIRELVWQLESDAPAGATIDRLEELLKSNQSARREFIYYTRLLADLEFNPNSAHRTPPMPAKVESPILGFLGSAVNISVAWFSSPKALALTVAGGLLTYFVVLVISIAVSRAFLADREPENQAGPSAAVSAKIIAASGCRWHNREPRTDVDGRLRADTSQLTQGVVDLEFDGGARVRIKGPAEFTPRSGNRIALTMGRLMAYVPRRARGFTVETQMAEIIDLGTEFGVEVDSDGKTEIHVLKGEVALKQTASGAASVGQAAKVGAGQAVRVSHGRALFESIPADVARFPVFPSAVERSFHSDDAASRYAEFVLDAKPIFYFPMESLDNTNDLEDRAPGGRAAKLHHSVASFGPLEPGAVGKALWLGGENVRDFAAMADYTASRTGDLTVVAWVLAKQYADFDVIVGNWGRRYAGADEPQGQFMLSLTDGKLLADITIDRPCRLQLMDTEPFPLGRWQHIALVVDHGIEQFRLYRNGRRVAEGTCQHLLRNVRVPALGIGFKTANDSDHADPIFPGYWKGAIDELAIFDRPLSDELIQKLSQRDGFE